MKLPKRIFFTGVPGSRWSGVSQIIERLDSFNKTDRTPERSYEHVSFAVTNGFLENKNHKGSHKGAYFGPGMEFDAKLDADYIDRAWEKDSKGVKLVKSHHWAYQLNDIKKAFPDDWIIVVFRDSTESFDWWKTTGGFEIKYPCYDAYKDDETMRKEIDAQNKAILDFVQEHSLTLEPFSTAWVKENLGRSVGDVGTKVFDSTIAILK